MSDPPADILRQLRPIPTSAGPPTTRPRDVRGVDPNGVPCRVDVVQAAAPVVLLFLSADCNGCRDLWAGLAGVHDGVGSRARLVVVTKSAPEEDPASIRALAGDVTTRLGIPVVMSAPTFGHYRAAAPFLVVVAPGEVLAEGVAWGVEETVRTAVSVLSPR
jgi:hypothetical protein